MLKKIKNNEISLNYVKKITKKLRKYQTSGFTHVNFIKCIQLLEMFEIIYENLREFLAK